MNELNSTRFFNVDCLKALAITFVVIYHCTTYSYDILVGTAESYIVYFLRAVLSTCVPMFFFVNGYLLLNQKFSIEKHAKKIFKLIVLTYIWAAINEIVALFSNGQSVELLSFIKGVVMLEGIGTNHFWYMSSLICIYIAFPLLKLTYDNDKKSFVFFTIICAAMTIGNQLLCDIATLVYKCILEKDVIFSLNFFNNFNLFRGIRGYSFVYFCCGGLIYNFEHKITEQRKSSISKATVIMITSTIGLTIWGVIRSRIAMETWDNVFHGYDTIFTFINVICLYILCSNIKSNVECKSLKKIVIKLSKNTLGIYFVHELFIMISRDYLTSYPIACNLGITIIYAIGIIVASMGFICMIKKIPYLNRLL